MKRPQTVANLLYKAFNQVNKGRYSDEAWEGINITTGAMKTVLNAINLLEDRKFDMWLDCEYGGYKSNRDGQIWKEYQVHIEDDGKNFLGGVITCSPCGRMDDNWSSYDLTLVLWND